MTKHIQSRTLCQVYNHDRLAVDEPRKSAIIAVSASILAARKLATVPRNSPACVAAIADAVANARRIV